MVLPSCGAETIVTRQVVMFEVVASCIPGEAVTADKPYRPDVGQVDINASG